MTSDGSAIAVRRRQTVRPAPRPNVSSPASPAPVSTTGDERAEDETSSVPNLDVSYWPMLRASLGVAVLTLVAQCASAAWVGLQAGHDVRLGRWTVIPFLQISTPSDAAFNSVVFWSSMISTVVLAVFATTALARCRSLQTQLGRSFAFLEISAIGVLTIASELWFQRSQGVSNWMLNLALGGAIAFAVAAWVVRDRYNERATLRDRVDQEQAPGQS